MPDRQRLLLIISVTVLVIVCIGGGVWWFISRDNNEDGAIPSTNTNSVVNTNTVPTGNTNDAVNQAGNTNQPADVQQNTSDEAAGLRIARIFVERYGTYSNRNNFENITNVQPFMTDRFKKETDGFVAAESKKPKAEEFYGITSTVLSVNTLKYSEKSAIQLEVATQRTETKGTEQPRTFTQNAVVNAVFVDGTWKVDTVQWQ